MLYTDTKIVDRINFHFKKNDSHSGYRSDIVSSQNVYTLERA